MKKCYKVILLYNHDYHQLKIGSEEMIKKIRTLNRDFIPPFCALLKTAISPDQLL